MLLHQNDRYHKSCVICERCHQKLLDYEYLVKDHRFYCHKVLILLSIFPHCIP